MKLSDKIVKLSSDLEVALKQAADKLESYNGDNLDDQTLIEAAESAYNAAGEVDGLPNLDEVIGALQSIEGSD